jgi:hypothetical protein
MKSFDPSNAAASVEGPKVGIPALTLTISPLISTYTLNFIFKLNTHFFSHSITD